MRKNAAKRQQPPTAPVPNKHDPRTMLMEVLKRHSLSDVVSQMWAATYSGGIVENDYGSRIFSRFQVDLTKLPPALCDAKEVLPPPELIPDSRDDLFAFLARLIVSPFDESKLDLVASGWPRFSARPITLADQVSLLLRIREQDKLIYEALVGGRFRRVIGQIQQQSPKNPIFAEQLERAVVVQALIWCSHDLQMVIARQAQAVTFGALASSLKKATPESILNVMRTNRELLEYVLGLYFRGHDWTTGPLPPKPVRAQHEDLTKAGDADLRRVAKQVRGIKADLTAGDIHELMCEIALALRSPSRTLLRARSPRSSNSDPKQWAIEHYGLSRLASANVAILRYVQAERELPQIIRNLIRNKVDLDNLFGGLPAWTSSDGKRGSASRPDELLIMYRETFLPSKNSRDISAARKARGQAERFLLEMGRREATDFHGSETDPRRAFYLLDVIPEQRFAL